MKLDLELVREILLEIEAAPPNRPSELKLPDREPDAVLEHLHLLKRKGLIEAKILPNRMDSRQFYHAYVEGNVVESPFAAVRLRTTAAKRFKKVENATALIWRLLRVAEGRFRQLNASDLLPDVAKGKRCVDGEFTKELNRKAA